MVRFSVTGAIKYMGFEEFYKKMYNFIELDNGCWRFNGYHDKDGYAYATFGRKYEHVPMYKIWLELYSGKVAPSKMVPDHLCKTTFCINPKHLEIVTVAENTRRGKSAKLNYKLVSEIKDLILSRQFSQADIARFYKVDPATITYIKQGKTWT
jgi:hypothetical protein